MKKELTQKMEAMIAVIAKMQVEVTVLNGINNKGMLISIVIDGAENETAQAANRIAMMAGSKFTDGGYDAECEAYFCGIQY